MPLPEQPVINDPSRPVLVVAFDGWADAGDAATRAVAHLADVSGAEVLGALDIDDFYDYQVRRPVTRGTGAERRIEWPGAKLRRGRIHGRELLLLSGPEPSFRWRTYVDAILAMVDDHRPQAVIVLSSHLGATPHTRQVPVHVVSRAAHLAAAGLPEPVHEGEVGIGTVLVEEAQRQGLPGVTMWSVVPNYLATDAYLGAALGLVQGVGELCGIDVPTDDLVADVRTERDLIDAELGHDPDLEDYVSELEQRWEQTSDNIADAVERFLRRQH